MHIRSKDTVVVITGKDKGKQGKVLTAFPKTGKVVVEGVAIATKHQKPRQQGMPGGIVKKEAFIDASNVMLICPKCGKAVRIGHKIEEVTGKDGKTRIGFFSQGYNPNYITGSQIVADIRQNLPPGVDPALVDEIHFYGAGVTELQYPFMERTLREVFPGAVDIFIAMDTLASCRALLQREPGFAAILGTGSNSCLYDGRDEVLNVDSCGFILGDEGSGGYLGKRLITDYIRRDMPGHVLELTGRKLGRSNDELLDIIYTKPFPNRFCAQYARFIGEHMDFDPYFPALVKDSFRKFFDRIVTHYPGYRDYSFNAVGSVAFHFQELLQEVVEEYGMRIGTILKAPMDGLVKYHCTD